MPEIVVETCKGRLRGAPEDDLVVFRGVPYAAPPTGRARWRRPRPAEPWSGVRDAVEFGPRAPQPPPLPAETFLGDPIEQSEDCLSLNLWTPGLDDGRRPVMVFVHGGGFTTGTGALGLYRGEHLARRGVVVVTINYRLGALGWLADPVLAEESGGCGNWGLWDQVAALEWVGRNIAAFGGNPDNVTVFGESAGAISVAALLGAPAARPLFRRAVIQSGAGAALGVESASVVAREVASVLGLPEVSPDALGPVPVGDLLAAQGEVMAAFAGHGLAFQPVVDGGLLRRHPAEEVVVGAAAGTDVVIGTNRDEWKFFTVSTPALRGLDTERLHRLVAAHVEAAALSDEVDPAGLISVVRSARGSRGESTAPDDLYAALATDWIFRVPSMRLAAAQSAHNRSTFTYLFDWECPLAGGALGSCHALELPFVFGTLRNPAVATFSGSGPDAVALSDRMQAAWVAFASTGDPTSDEGGEWPPYEPVRRATKRLGPVVEVVEGPRETERARLDAALGTYGTTEAAALGHVRRPPQREAGVGRGT